MIWPADVPRPRDLLGRALRRGLKGLATRRATGEGVVDLPNRRYQLDFGSYAVMGADGMRSGGPSGGAPRDPHPEEGHSPLWLLDLLEGIVEAKEVSTGEPWRRLEVTIDLGKAADASPAFHMPGTPASLDWRARPATVWIERGELRRIEFVDEHVRHALDLFDLGGFLDDVDWNRLPDTSSGSAGPVSARRARGGADPRRSGW